MKPSSLRDLIARASRTLGDAGVATPEVDARLIAASLLDVPPLNLLFTDAPADFERDYAAAIARRARREPLQHITGSAQFGPLELRVGPGVFIPRPETEVLAQWAVDILEAVADPLVVDLGTGSGALAIFIAAARPDARVVAVERSEAARGYARANAEDNLGAGVASLSIVPGDMTDPELLAELTGAVDLVVANPPYVPEDPALEPEVYFDPAEAVFSGADGMEAIRGLVPVAARLLAPGGALGIEHDDTTSDAARAAVRESGAFSRAEVLEDLTGRARFVTASKLNA
ncbi:peptide chain release factor N(5)-glutamine methyltransferase [Corynebacterium senegalense]|uniref:peptide chain release factor N(5)-glutamine methyltransferase n=1 Tax=Corynebacterium senegalense TaxID=2080750 RepID=UPI000E1FEA4A|nr:peptide chain release factor N(5)-glutamine methyltransferase [Corynebacterium senegalense]